MFHPIQHSDFNQRTESSESVVKCDQGSATSGSVEYSLARPVFIGNSLRSAGCCGSSSVGHWLATQQHGRRHPPQSYPKHFLFFFFSFSNPYNCLKRKSSSSNRKNPPRIFRSIRQLLRHDYHVSCSFAVIYHSLSVVLHMLFER